MSRAIRMAKDRCRNAHRFGNAANEQAEQATLNALRVQADLLMLFRTDISISLRETAYRYAPREAVA